MGYLSILCHLSLGPFLVSAWNILADETRAGLPQVIGHAGSSGYVPESTLQGYDLAAFLQADYSEPDLVLTRDGHFIAMHDLTLDDTTDVASFPEYANRKSTFVVEGEPKTGFYAINFTLSEIKGLRVHQRFEGRSKLYDGLLQVPTLGEIMDWQISFFSTSGRLVGIYPELKHPDWHNSVGYPMEDLFISALSEAGYHVNDAETPRDLSEIVPVAIQCFKNESLKYLSTISNIPLVQLLGISNEQPDSSTVYTEAVLDEVMTYASAVAPDKKLFTTDWGVSVQEAIRMRKWAKDRGLQFTPWSFQQEPEYIPLQFEGDTRMEMLFYYGCLESTAIFHEFPDQARLIATECQELAEPTCFKLCPYSNSLD